MAGSRPNPPVGRDPWNPAPFTPGPLGRNDCADPSWPAIGDTPGSLGMNDAAGMCRPGLPRISQSRPRVTCKVLLFDSQQLARFFRSSAYARFLQNSLHLEYKEEKTLFFTVVYKYLFLGQFGMPGVVEISTGDPQQIQQKAEAQTEQDLETFLQKCAKGPAAAIAFLRGREEIRQSSYEDIQRAYAEASELNSEIQQATASGIARLAAIKMASTIVLKVAEKFAPPGASTLISLGYDISCETIKDLDSKEAEGAGAIAVAGEHTAKAAGTEAGKQIVEKGAEAWEKGLEAQAKKLEARSEQISATIEREQGWLAKATKSRKIKHFTNKIAENEGKLQGVAGALKTTQVKRLAAKSVGWLFLAKDIYDAVDEYRETVAAAGE